MSLKLKPIAALALAGAAAISAVALVTTGSARAATEACGSYCVTMASQSLGTGQEIAVSGTGGVLMAPGFNAHEDFIGLPVGTVAELAQAGQIPKALAATYGEEIVYEFSYAPRGALTGDCLGVSSPSVGARAALQYCGAPTNGQPAPMWEAQKGTLWIGVYRDHVGDFEPFVNVAASKGAAVVLQANAPGGALTLNFMHISGGRVAANQMWESLIGAFPHAQAWPTPKGNEPLFPQR
ncbi:MAG TPA: hypothetical protein VFB06_33835 [Streptosporangiaceae bacterium]|nr:hypothetical protein [Streptosporangiaceae bacterium]